MITKKKNDADYFKPIIMKVARLIFIVLTIIVSLFLIKDKELLAIYCILIGILVKIKG